MRLTLDVLHRARHFLSFGDSLDESAMEVNWPLSRMVSKREQSMTQACRHRQDGGLADPATLRPLWPCRFLRS